MPVCLGKCNNQIKKLKGKREKNYLFENKTLSCSLELSLAVLKSMKHNC